MKHEPILTDDEVQFALSYADESPDSDRQALLDARAVEQAILTKQAEKAQPVAWMIDTHGFADVAIKKEDLGLLANRYAFPLYTHPPAPSALLEATLTNLDSLKDDAAVHIWPKDLEKCSRSECVVKVYSVRMGSPDGKTVPLFSREQVSEALRAAIEEHKK